MAVCLQAHVSMQEPGCRSPIASPGMVDRPSKRRVARHAFEGSGPDAAKPVSDQPALAWWKDLAKRQGSPEPAEQGVLAPARVKVRGQPGAAWNALLLLAQPRAEAAARQCMLGDDRRSQSQEIVQIRLACRDPGQPRLRLRLPGGRSCARKS
jgi:hypothetical protein